MATVTAHFSASRLSSAAPDDNGSRLDLKVTSEMEKFEQIRASTLSRVRAAHRIPSRFSPCPLLWRVTQGLDDQYYFGTARFNLRAFWADHKSALPLHEKVFRAEVGPKLRQTRDQSSSVMATCMHTALMWRARTQPGVGCAFELGSYSGSS